MTHTSRTEWEAEAEGMNLRYVARVFSPAKIRSKLASVDFSHSSLPLPPGDMVVWRVKVPRALCELRFAGHRKTVDTQVSTITKRATQN